MITMLALLALTLAVVITKRATVLAERRREAADGDWAEEFCAAMRPTPSVARGYQYRGGSTIHL